jgi:chemotaxis protein histidine kinase CheA
MADTPSEANTVPKWVLETTRPEYEAWKSQHTRGWSDAEKATMYKLRHEEVQRQYQANVRSERKRKLSDAQITPEAAVPERAQGKARNEQPEADNAELRAISEGCARENRRLLDEVRLLRRVEYELRQENTNLVAETVRKGARIRELEAKCGRLMADMAENGRRQPDGVYSPAADPW